MRWTATEEGRQAIFAYACMSPWFVGLILFTLGPLIISAALSFTDYDLLSHPKYAGVENYSRLAGDSVFWVAAKNTAIFTVVTVVLGVFGSLALAMAFDRLRRIGYLARAIFYLPTVTPIVVIAVMWSLILNPIFGLVNLGLASFGRTGPGWLTSPDWSMISIIVVYLWWTVGGDRMIIFLAGLQNIPEYLYEAARMDGARRLTIFRHVTLPMLGPVLLLNVVLSLIYSLQVFVTPLILTDGGPANSTMVVLLYLYKNAFLYNRFGYASAIATIFMLVCGIVIWLVMRVSRSLVYYEGDAG